MLEIHRIGSLMTKAIVRNKDLELSYIEIDYP